MQCLDRKAKTMVVYGVESCLGDVRPLALLIRLARLCTTASVQRAHSVGMYAHHNCYTTIRE